MRRNQGFTLLEVVLALSLTLIVMALVAQTMAHVRLVFEAQTQLATTGGNITLAVDDIAREIAGAGQGLGEDVPSVVPRNPESSLRAGDSVLALRSSPRMNASFVRAGPVAAGENIALADGSGFEDTETVVLVDVSGIGELADVVQASGDLIRIRSRERADGTLRRRYPPSSATRVLSVREVRYYVREGEDGTGELVKDVVAESSRVLARGVTSLVFEYLDADGRAISPAKVEQSRELRTVRVSVSYLPERDAFAERLISTAVTLPASSGVVDFERRGGFFRLTGVLHPIDHPIAVGSRPGAGWGVVLGAGTHPQQDPAFAFTFPLERQFLGASVEDVAFFDDVRAPVTLAFGPEESPLAGSLFVAAWGLRLGHLTRILPDAYGKLSGESEVVTYDGTEAVAQAGGIAFGVDGALYVTSLEKGAIYRYRFGDSARPSGPELLFKLPGSPGAISEGTDGFLYFLMDRGRRSSLWRIAFDENLVPLEPFELGELPGAGLSLTRDPIEGSFLALVKTPLGDYIVVEIDRGWIHRAEQREEYDAIEVPAQLFSLREWQGRLEEGRVEPGEIPFGAAELPQRMDALRTEQVHFIGFDAYGSLYMGASEDDVVFKFELPRPSGRYALGVAAGLVERGSGLSPELEVHVWKKSALAY